MPGCHQPRVLLLLLAILPIHACTRAPPAPDAHYVLGQAYQAAGVWFYPRESYDLDETGVAAVLAGDHAPLTTDGEVFDQSALAAANPTLQLPAIVRLTNLENGRQITARLNDRGTPDPRRLVQVTQRAATLLGMTPDGVARIHLQVLTAESRAAVDSVPGAPKLALTPAPRGVVAVADLSPPPGVRQGGGRVLTDAVVATTSDIPDAPPPPMRLPENVVQTVPQPGRLMVRLDTFEDQHYAAAQQAKMRSAGARVVTFRDGRTWEYRVEIGPLQDVASADAVLLQAIGYGIPDARIVID